MNIMIEDAETLQFAAAQGGWTKNVTEGKLFDATGAAFAFARKEPVGKFNIVCYIQETEQFINLNHGRGKGIEVAAA